MSLIRLFDRRKTRNNAQNDDPTQRLIIAVILDEHADCVYDLDHCLVRSSLIGQGNDVSQNLLFQEETTGETLQEYYTRRIGY